MLLTKLTSAEESAPKTQEQRNWFHLTIFRIMDSYVLAGFLFYFVLWICAFVAMTQIYNFFELLGDIVKNNIPMSKAAHLSSLPHARC